MVGQQGNIVLAFPQGRKVNLDNLEAIIQILAKLTIGYFVWQDLVRGSDNAHINLNRGGIANALKLHGFESPQQTQLHAWRDVAYFIEEKGAAVSALKTANLVTERPGKGASHMSKEFTFQEIFGKRCAVDLDQGFISPVAIVVQGL